MLIKSLSLASPDDLPIPYKRMPSREVTELLTAVLSVETDNWSKMEILGVNKHWMRARIASVRNLLDKDGFLFETRIQPPKKDSQLWTLFFRVSKRLA